MTEWPDWPAGLADLARLDADLLAQATQRFRRAAEELTEIAGRVAQTAAEETLGPPADTVCEELASAIHAGATEAAALAHQLGQAEVAVRELLTELGRRLDAAAPESETDLVAGWFTPGRTGHRHRAMLAMLHRAWGGGCRDDPDAAWGAVGSGPSDPAAEVGVWSSVVSAPRPGTGPELAGIGGERPEPDLGVRVPMLPDAPPPARTGGGPAQR